MKDKRKIRIGINGLGRIGRAVFRINAEKKLFDIVAINDINPDVNNLAYLLKYDSIYGRFKERLEVQDENIIFDDHLIGVSHEEDIRNVPWAELGIDLVIDASGVYNNVLAAKDLIERGVPKVLITHAPDEVDLHLVLGVNEEVYDHNQHHVVSSSICDAVAIAPVLKVLDDNFGVQNGFLTTLHPWLSYQNLMDGPSQSWSLPGKIYHHYVLGRASTHSLIPKSTTAMAATVKIMPHLAGTIKCFSYRVPVPVVGSADLSIELAKNVKLDEVKAVFKDFEEKQRWDVFHNLKEPLVSCDFLGSSYSATIDHRWTSLSGKKLLKIVLWYDNEWGYSSRVVDVANYIGQKIERETNIEKAKPREILTA